MHIGEASPLLAAVAAVSVGLLTAGTLGTVAAVSVGAVMHLIGLPDAWAEGVAAATAVACLVPCAALARLVWQVERRSGDR